MPAKKQIKTCFGNITLIRLPDESISHIPNGRHKTGIYNFGQRGCDQERFNAGKKLKVNILLSLLLSGLITCGFPDGGKPFLRQDLVYIQFAMGGNPEFSSVQLYLSEKLERIFIILPERNNLFSLSLIPAIVSDKVTPFAQLHPKGQEFCLVVGQKLQPLSTQIVFDST